MRSCGLNHVIIDEAQDLRKVQLDFINELRENSENSSILFLTDVAYSLLVKDQNITEDENFVKPSLLEKRGEYPVYRHSMNQTQEIDYFIRKIY